MTNQYFFRNFSKQTLITIKNELINDYTEFCLDLNTPDETLAQINQTIDDIDTELNSQYYRNQLIPDDEIDRAWEDLYNWSIKQ